MGIMDLCEICGNPEHYTTHDGVKHTYKAHGEDKKRTSLGMCSRCVQRSIAKEGK